MIRKTLLIGIALASLVIPARGNEERAPQWTFPYAFRRPVFVSPNQRWRDAKVAALAFPMGESASAERAGTLLVTDAEGKPVPVRVLFASPRKRSTLLFRGIPGNRYFVYFEPEEGAEASPSLEVNRGLILETFKRPRGPCNSWAQMQALLDSAGEKQGAGAVPNVFLGHNPFGSSRGFISVFKGFLEVRKGGTYAICTASSDASFVFVDGREIVSWPGRHGPGPGLWGRMKGTVELEAGLHEFAYYHECRGNMPIAVLGWFPPGERAPKLVTQDAFPGFLKAGAGALQRRDGLPAADFFTQPSGVARVGSAYLYAVHLRALANPKTPLRWDFGDGLQGEGKEIDHVFLEEKVFRVRLTSWREGEEGKASTFEQDVDTSVLLPHWRAPKKPEFYMQLLKDYDYPSMESKPLASLLSVFREHANWRDEVKILSVLAERSEDFSPGERTYRALRLGNLRLALGDSAKAMEAYAKAIASNGHARWALQAEVGLSRAAFMLGSLAPDAAIKTFAALAARAGGGNPDVARQALFASGDVHLAAGDGGKALDFYRAGHALGGKNDVPDTALVRKGGFSSEVRGWIEKSNFEKARQRIWEWEEDYPEEKLEGYSATLRARSYILEARYDEVVRAADAFLRLGLSTHFTAPLLFMKGTALWGLEKPEEATKALSLLVKQYPETPEKAKAERLLERIKTGKK